MSAATMMATQAAILNGNRRYGGGGNGSNDDDEIKFWAGICAILIVIMCFIGYLMFVKSHDRPLPDYVVYGTLHSYQTKRYSKQDRVFVNILQSDGQIRQYRTTYKPSECYQRTVAVYLPVKVSPTYNDWTGDTRYDSQLMLDACAK